MSLETWKNEFYQVEARNVPEEGAVLHSLKKWRGLTEENLKKHGVEKVRMRAIADENGETFDIDLFSCALCKHYLNDKCINCPLFELLGVPCDRDNYCSEDEDEDEDELSPYNEWSLNNNPNPMINLLEKAAV